MSFIQWIAALMPVLSVAIFLVVMRMPASRAMPIALVVTIVLAMAAWGVPALQISASTIEGLIIASSVVFIVLGALAFLDVMKASGGLALIRLDFLKVSPDNRIQMLFVGWLLVNFLEGAAGFGTPATVAAPLLIALGFPAMAAVCLALMADVSAVTFGAVGTPIIVGLTQGTGRDWTNPDDAALMTDVALQAALIDIVAGMTIPVLMLLFLTRVFAAEKSKRSFVEMVPLAIVAALSFSVPAYLWTLLLGVEFGGILGAATGMAVLFVIVRLGILVPKAAWSVKDGYIDPGELERLVEQTTKEVEEAHLSTARVWAPYVLLTVLLLITRIVEPVKDGLLSWTAGWSDILGTDITAGFEPLYSPGLIFVIVAAFTAWLHHLTREQLRKAGRHTAKAVVGAGIVLIAAVPIVRVFLNSGVNSEGLLAMPLELADAAADSVGQNWPVAAPFVGVLGSFVSGSATFSHLMFGALQESVAESVGVSPEVVLAQQVGGANAGNMVCVTNVVTVCAVGGMLGSEGSIIRMTVWPMIAYSLVFVGMGMWLA